MKLAALLLACTLAFAADLPVNGRFVGAWKLVSYESRNASGEVTFPLGRVPVGRLSYDAAGLMMIHIMRSERASFASGDPRAATSQEIESAFRGTTAYFGTYSVDEKAGEVTHHVEASLFPNLSGSDVRRQFRFEQDNLVLEGKNAAGGIKLVWQRVP